MTAQTGATAGGGATVGRSGETLVVVNPASSSGRTAARWPGIEQQLRSLGVPVAAELTEGVGDAIRIARDFVRAGGRDIVVLGGDGTIGEVVAGCVDESGHHMLADDITLAVVHQGTGGDFAHGLGIPKENLAAALEIAANGVQRVVDVAVATFVGPEGQLQVRGFASCANVGMGAEVVRKVTGRLKRVGDTAAFAIATVGCLLRNRPRHVTLTLDGVAHELDIVDIVMANNRFMGGGMLVAPDAQLDDGLLDVVVISAAGRLKLIRTFPKIYKGTHVDEPIVRVTRTREVRVDAAGAGQGVVLDGEPVGHTPARFHVLPGALRVRVAAD